MTWRRRRRHRRRGQAWARHLRHHQPRLWPAEGETVDASRAYRRLAVSTPPDLAVRRGEVADAEAIGRLLHDFNSEFDESTPGPRRLAERVRQLITEGEITVLLAGAGPDGVAVLRFRPSIWTQALESYLAELYVVPDRRGQGLGRALMEAA